SGHTSVISGMDECYHDFKYRRQHYETFLKEFYRTSPRRIGYKLIASQHDAAMVYSIFEPSIKVIYLYRENILATYSSEQIAKATGQDRVDVGSDVIESKAVFEPVEFRKRCRARLARHDLYLELLKRSRKRYFVLEYQELQSPEKRRQLLEFLGVEPKFELVSQYVKRNSGDIVSRFANPDDVMNSLQEMGRLEWAVEGS
ncbi:MAG: hypothetical protein AAF405_02940, partial [Pseudomonadota bacterium]